MASTDRSILKNVSISIDSADATPTQLPVCITDVGWSMTKGKTDATASCDAGKVYIYSDIVEDVFTFTIPWEGDSNTAHTRLQSLSRSSDLVNFTMTFKDGATVTAQVNVSKFDFRASGVDGLLSVSVELTASNGITYTPGP